MWALTKEDIKALSPLLNFSSTHMSTLFMHGNRDQFASYHQAERFSELIRDSGAVSECKIYPGKKHNCFLKGMIFMYQIARLLSL